MDIQTFGASFLYKICIICKKAHKSPTYHSILCIWACVRIDCIDFFISRIAKLQNAVRHALRALFSLGVRLFSSGPRIKRGHCSLYENFTMFLYRCQDFFGAAFRFRQNIQPEKEKMYRSHSRNLYIPQILLPIFHAPSRCAEPRTTDKSPALKTLRS